MQLFQDFPLKDNTEIFMESNPCCHIVWLHVLGLDTPHSTALTPHPSFPAYLSLCPFSISSA